MLSKNMQKKRVTIKLRAILRKRTYKFLLARRTEIFALTLKIETCIHDISERILIKFFRTTRNENVFLKQTKKKIFKNTNTRLRKEKILFFHSKKKTRANTHVPSEKPKYTFR